MDINDFSDAIDKLYTRFVFRDILAYLLPGSIFLFLIWPVLPITHEYSKQIPVKLYWGGLILFAYAIGRVLQDLGSWLPYPFGNLKYRLTLLGIWDYLHPREYFNKEVMFIERTQEGIHIKYNIGANYRLYRERINLLKLMSGNLAMSFLCAGLLRLFLPSNESSSMPPFLFLAAIAFWISHFSLARQKCNWESIMIGRKDQNGAEKNDN